MVYIVCGLLVVVLCVRWSVAVVCCVLLDVCCLMMCVVWRLWFVACCLLVVACWLLFVVGRLLLLVVFCLLPIGCLPYSG